MKRLGGYPPFYDEDETALLDIIAEGTFNFPDAYWAHVSPSGSVVVLLFT